MNEPKAKRIKKQYDEAFRRNAVALVEGSGRSLKEIAAELSVTHWNLRDWTKQHGRNQPVPAATPAEMHRELQDLLAKDHAALTANSMSSSAVCLRSRTNSMDFVHWCGRWVDSATASRNKRSRY